MKVLTTAGLTKLIQLCKNAIPTVPVTDVTVGGTSVVSSGVAVVPAIPTVNDSTITITQGGVTKGSFTLNQASGDTIALDAGGSNYHPELLSHEWDDHLRNDTQWLRADTFSWQDGSVYEAAYDHLEADITGKTLTSETVAGTTVQFYLADDGHKICPDTEESNVAAIYTATGVAWYYIIDTVNERFKLPRTKFGVTGLRDTVGNYVAPGLPDITSGSAAVMAWYNNQSTWTQGSLKKTDTTAGSMATSGNWTNAGITALRASFESSIYGNSTTVQAPATQMYLYFYVGEFTQTALENTAGLNASLFNGKADVDLSNAASNASSSAKETIVGWGLPDYSASVSKNVGTSYTATEDGVVEVYIQTNNNVRMAFTFNGVETRFATSVAGTGGFGTVYKPIKAGDTYLVSQTAGEGTYDVFLYQFTPYSY